MPQDGRCSLQLCWEQSMLLLYLFFLWAADQDRISVLRDWISAQLQFDLYCPDRRPSSQLCYQHFSSACRVFCRKGGCRDRCRKTDFHDFDRSDRQEHAPDNDPCVLCNLRLLFTKQHTHCRHRRTAFQSCTFRPRQPTDRAWHRIQQVISPCL